MARRDDHLRARGGYLVSLDFAHLEPALVVLAHCQHTAAAAATEVVAAIGHHLHKIRHHLPRHIAKRIVQTAVAHNVAGVVNGVFLGIQSLVHLDTPHFDILLQLLNQRHHLEVGVGFQIVGGLPAQGTRAVAALAEHQSIAFQLVHLIEHLLCDGRGLLVVAGEIAIVGHVIHLRGEGPAGASGIENLGGSSNGEREELGLAGVQRVQNLFALLVQGDGGVFAQLVLQILLHPLNGVHKILRGNAHIVARLDSGVHCGLERLGHLAHRGQHTAAGAHHKGNVHANGAVLHAAPAHRAGPEQRVHHLGDGLVVQLAGVSQFGSRAAQ